MATNESSAYERSVSAVVEKARECLTEILQKSGTILYSSCETLKPGDYYFLGVNPGGSPEETKETIQSTLEELGALTKAAYENAYLDQCWCGKEGCAGCCRPLQKRFRFLFKDVLEVDPRVVCATNLIFQRSRSERDAGGWELAKTCWPVHDSSDRREIRTRELAVAIFETGDRTSPHRPASSKQVRAADQG